MASVKQRRLNFTIRIPRLVSSPAGMTDRNLSSKLYEMAGEDTSHGRGKNQEPKTQEPKKKYKEPNVKERIQKIKISMASVKQRRLNFTIRIPRLVS